MIIESLVGLVLMISGGGEKSVDPTSAIIKGIKQVNKIQEQNPAYGPLQPSFSGIISRIR